MSKVCVFWLLNSKLLNFGFRVLGILEIHGDFARIIVVPFTRFGTIKQIHVNNNLNS